MPNCGSRLNWISPSCRAVHPGHGRGSGLRARQPSAVRCRFARPVCPGGASRSEGLHATDVGVGVRGSLLAAGRAGSSRLARSTHRGRWRSDRRSCCCTVWRMLDGLDGCSAADRPSRAHTGRTRSRWTRVRARTGFSRWRPRSSPRSIGVGSNAPPLRRDLVGCGDGRVHRGVDSQCVAGLTLLAPRGGAPTGEPTPGSQKIGSSSSARGSIAVRGGHRRRATHVVATTARRELRGVGDSWRRTVNALAVAMQELPRQGRLADDPSAWQTASRWSPEDDPIHPIDVAAGVAGELGCRVEVGPRPTIAASGGGPAGEPDHGVPSAGDPASGQVQH